jgi:hypothetical protein
MRVVSLAAVRLSSVESSLGQFDENGGLRREFRAVEKEKEFSKFQFSTRPWNTRVFRQITSLFCQVGEQFTQPGNAVSRRKRTQSAKVGKK